MLFRIDPAPFKADLDSAEAALRKAEANAFQAKLQEQRYAQLIDDKAISAQDYDNARANARQTAADVAANKAAVERAKLSLGYATVTAPISGRVGRALVTEGALVGQNETTPLALIQQLNPIYADLTQSTRELNELRRAFRSGQLQAVGQDQVKATLIQDDGSLYPLPASCCSVTSRSIQALARSSCAASSPIPISTCCRAVSFAYACNKRPCRTASPYRNVRCSVTAQVSLRC